MIRLWPILFWPSVLWLAYVYFGYPLLLWLAGFWKQFHPRFRDDYLPKVSVLISARNEEKDIGWKVSESLSWSYPAERLELIIASDASEDRTDEILQSFKDSRLKYLRMDSRVGKNEALNRLARVATGDLLLFTDANTHVGKDCLRGMVRYFSDPRVGCVTGTEHTQTEEQELAISSGTRAYLDYELLINRLESRVGSVIVCDGSLFVVRRSLFHQLQPDLANDLELPLSIGNASHALLCDPTAIAIEKAMRSSREEYNRKRRICGQGFLGFWRLRRCLRGFRAWQFFSRKVLRWLALIPMTVILLTTGALLARPFFAFLFALQVVFYLLALGGWLFDLAGRKASAIFTMPYYFLVVNIAAVIGVFQACIGRRFAVWEVPAYSRGPSESRREIHCP
jgi:cellulose synthase/poly-beta-1,6-N-acetylglucosamine synthase-like glycosyltransferase